MRSHKEQGYSESQKPFKGFCFLHFKQVKTLSYRLSVSRKPFLSQPVLVQQETRWTPEITIPWEPVLPLLYVGTLLCALPRSPVLSLLHTNHPRDRVVSQDGSGLEPRTRQDIPAGHSKEDPSITLDPASPQLRFRLLSLPVCRGPDGKRCSILPTSPDPWVEEGPEFFSKSISEGEDM